jgi:hypothetical protein
MKKTLVISVFLGFTLLSNSQIKFFLPDSNSFFSVSSFKFFFQGDTIINKKTYKKVFQQNGDTLADFAKALYYASVREDTFAQKIYCIQKDDGVERLIADFSLEIGDTGSVYSYWPFSYPYKVNVKIKSIDSIFIFNNYRKRLNIDETQGCFGEGESWIEGIGSTHGLFFPFSVYPDLGCTELLCVYIKNILYYKNPNYTSCFINIWLGFNEKKIDVMKVYPTIVDDYLFLEKEIEINNHLNYRIYNYQGLSIKNGILTSNRIDVSNLSKGVYFVLFSNVNFKSKTFKFIKN